MANMESTIAKNPPKSFMFDVPFRGIKGGKHQVKFKFILQDGYLPVNKFTPLKTKEEALRVQKLYWNAPLSRKITRRVAWHEKKPGTNYGRGEFKGYLIYGLPLEVVKKSHKVKKEWSPGYQFKYGEE